MKPEDAIFVKKFTAMAIGNVLEWFDFSSFGALVDIIGHNFFSDGGGGGSHILEFIKALGVFGVAFLMRPIGGIFIGWVGDTMGRRRALELSILLMLVPSFLIGCLPTYAQAGWIAPVALLLLRCFQGMAAGGEIVGAFIYTIEATHGVNMGFWGGACKATGNLGTALGVGLVTLLRSVLTEQQMLDWGWRLPFWVGLLFGACGLYARQSLKSLGAASDSVQLPPIRSQENGKDDSNDDDEHHHKSHMSTVVSRFWPEILTIMLVSAFWGCAYYTAFIWMVYYMEEEKLSGGGIHYAWLIVFAANLSLVLALPLGGWLGDYNGRSMNDAELGTRVTMQLALLLMLAGVIPAFMLILTTYTVNVLFGMLLFVVPVAIFGANLPAFMAAQFFVQFRFSGIGIGYNLAHALFSSTASIIQTSLILANFKGEDRRSVGHPTGQTVGILGDYRMRPAFYLIAVTIMSFAALAIGGEICRERRERIAKSQFMGELVSNNSAAGEKAQEPQIEGEQAPAVAAETISPMAPEVAAEQVGGQNRGPRRSGGRYYYSTLTAAAAPTQPHEETKVGVTDHAAGASANNSRRQSSETAAASSSDVSGSTTIWV